MSKITPDNGSTRNTSMLITNKELVQLYEDAQAFQPSEFLPYIGARRVVELIRALGIERGLLDDHDFTYTDIGQKIREEL